MAGRLRRFLLLERPRPIRAGEEDPSAATAARIGGVERPGAAPGETVAPGHLDRFRAPPERPLELDERREAAQPFVRCMRCETDNGVFAAVCSTCGAALDDPEQRAFNERLWAARQAESRAEAAAAKEREAERRVLGEAQEKARRALGETLAREVGDLERRRVEAEERSYGSGGAFGSGFDAAPVGLKILRRLPDWRWQLGAMAAAVALVATLVAVGRAGHPWALMMAAVVTAVLIVPPGLRIRRW